MTLVLSGIYGCDKHIGSWRSDCEDCKTNSALRKEVFRALDNSLENGYDEVLTNSPLAIAEDLNDDDKDLESADPEKLVRFINEWREHHQ